MFSENWTPTARQQYDALRAAAEASREARRRSGKKKSSKQEGLFSQVRKAIRLLLNDTRHPSLQTHEYHSLENPYDKQAKVFEAYVQHKTPGAYRVFWCYGPEKSQITIITITPHP